jgi:hypothetical protein
MSKNFIKGRVSLRTGILAALVIAVPAGAWAGFSAQGFSAQGFSAQGFSAQGFSAQGFSAQGFSAQGFSAQGFSAQGFSAQGFSAQGFSAQGFSAQGFSAQGTALLGNDVVMSDLKGVDIGSVDVRGTTSDSGVVAIELTQSATMSTGSGTYISVGGGSAVGHFATAHLVDAFGNPAEDLDLYIAGEMRDPLANEQHRAENQANDDIQLYEVFYYLASSGQWASLCPFHDLTGATTAMAIPEDPANPNKFIFACTATGVAAKCAHIWGYRPWHHNDTSWVFDDGINDWVEQSFDQKPFYDMCKTAARAGYCQDRQSFTRNGTFVDLFDTRQLVWPNAIENPLSAENPNSQWMFAQEYFVTSTPLVSDPSLRVTALQRTRWRDLSPVGQCPDSFADISRLEVDHFEDARFANPLVADPRIEVFSPNYCQHSENEVGTALAWDCSPCTTAVCRHDPQCCSADPTLPQPVWNAATCVADQVKYCQDVENGGGPWWPLGKVWPRDFPASTAPQKYLIGPGGAVEQTAGVSTGGTSATVQGWACDPEWPGTAVPGQFYGGAPREHGGTLLGTVYADQALAAPLAAEVATACDGLGHPSALHGFSFTLPTSTTGNVFVYALDSETPDGPAAPPTLLRNGIVHVPTCDHSEHLAGTALASSCSTCAAAVCAKGGLGDCCVTAWSDECAAAAESCEPGDSSAAADGRAFGETLTGWIEAPTTGTYVFAATAQPSRVEVNGTKLVDWLEAVGPTSGSIVLQGGGRYHVRWDRFQASPPGSGTDPGLTWQPPGALAQQAIPAAALYRVVPGVGTGLDASYYQSTNLTGPAVPRLDAAVEQSSTTVLPAPIVGPSYSVAWEGEIVPLYSDTYTFTLVAAGAATLEVGGTTIVTPTPPAPPLTGCLPHDICALGDKLAATTTTQNACDPCVDQICAKDPFCCNGGYLSYYSTEPVWDAKCITEVGTVCGLTCKNPIPAATTQPHESTPIALQAGVRTHIRATVAVTTSDNTVQLIWASTRQPRGPVPTASLYPTLAPGNAGAGLNLVSFATTNGGTKIDFTTPLASGAAPDLTLAPPVGPSGLPVVPVLAAPDDAAAGTPAPPVLVTPRPNATVYNGAAEIPVSGMGGLVGGSVHVHVQGTATNVILPVASDGTYSGSIPVGAYGTYTLRLTQRSYPGATCVSPPAPFCAVSTSVDWTVTVAALLPGTPPPPVITSPRDPTASPNAASDTFPVTGTATPGAVNVCDLGTGTTFTNQVTADGNGNINDSIQLSHGSTGSPAQGWHKLVFSTAPCPPPAASGSAPVFVSVGIRPPTVTFPRTGAEIDCSPNPPNPNPGFFDVTGSIPYPEGNFGRLRIAEETGRLALQQIQRDISIDVQHPNADGSLNFHTSLNLPPGKHLIYFFQAPDPDPTLTPDQQAEFFRAYARIADTPTSHIALRVPPPRLQLPSNKLGADFTAGPITFGDGNCSPTNANGGNGVDCALPEADVNLRVDGRTWTTRADLQGNWSLTLDLTPGWHHLRASQVVDSRAGGGWQEGCPSDGTLVGVSTGNGNLPTLQLPGLVAVPAAGPNGAVVSYSVSATTVTGKPATIACTPPSGSTFPLGLTRVLCTAIDPDTGAVGVDMFEVAVVDGPPVVTVPADITAEAQNALGAVVSWDASATDVVSGPLPVECAPSSPALFSIDLTTPVTCQATDGSGNTTTASFNVTVRDTTPPTLCPLPNVRVLAAGPGGGAVTFKTCASDLVDGSDPVTCDHPSGSFFPVGKTVVTCTSTDRHLNVSPASSFVVDVGDSTPPVLKLPGTITVAATSRAGARVSYSVTATDDTDPHPTVSCAPPSGGVFPLGDTTVSCSATDASGNRSTGAFHVRVLVSFGGFLPLINNNGSSVFYRPVPILVRFALADQSLNVFDLPAKLYLAKVDSTGHVGPEQPAAGLPPAVGNNFVFVGLPLLLVREYDLLMDDHALSAGVWQLRVDLGDGVAHTVRITLR